MAASFSNKCINQSKRSWQKSAMRAPSIASVKPDHVIIEEVVKMAHGRDELAWDHTADSLEIESSPLLGRSQGLYG